MTLRITHAGLSDIGRVRRNNEDRWLADPQQGLYVVADGIGGNIGGGLAADIVVDTLPGFVRKRIKDITDLASSEAAARLKSTLSEFSNRLRSESRGEPGLDGMGSTVVLVLIRNTYALIAHMGDSRAYFLRDGTLQRLTKDHTIVQLLSDAGEISAEETATHPARGRLTHFVGMEGEPLPETRLLEIHPGDRLLLCSDGLTTLVGDQQLSSIMRHAGPPEITCVRLIQAANEAGGTDNITVIVTDVHPG